MMMAGKLNINQGPVYSEDNVNFYGTQIQLMQSAEVRRSAQPPWSVPLTQNFSPFRSS